VKCPFCPEAVEIPEKIVEPESPHTRVQAHLEESATEQEKEISAGLTEAQMRLKTLERKARAREQTIEQLVEGLLLDGEQVLHYAKPNWVILASRMAVNLALFASLIIIDVAVLFANNQVWYTIFWIVVHFAMAGVVGYLMYYAWAHTLYILTNLRVISRSGLLSVTITSIPLGHLRSISCKSSLLDKAAGLGSLKFYV
jgi:uncharacterized membrane protein YdbT with pleckstrin-like domain